MNRGFVLDRMAQFVEGHHRVYFGSRGRKALDPEGIAGGVGGTLGTWTVRELRTVLNRSPTLIHAAEAHLLWVTLGAGPRVRALRHTFW